MEQKFVSYDYKTIKVREDSLGFYLDAYESFGWQTDERLTNLQAEGTATLHLKRDRKLLNRMELTRLQRNFEGCMEEIADLEKEKSRTATAVSIAVGIIGTVFVGGSVFAVTASPPIIWLCVMLAVPGFTCWVLPYFLYRGIKRRKTEQVDLFIEKKYEEITGLMEKGHSLL